jgi:hypothetical protein
LTAQIMEETISTKKKNSKKIRLFWKTFFKTSLVKMNKTYSIINANTCTTSTSQIKIY